MKNLFTIVLVDRHNTYWVTKFDISLGIARCVKFEDNDVHAVRLDDMTTAETIVMQNNNSKPERYMIAGVQMELEQPHFRTACLRVREIDAHAKI